MHLTVLTSAYPRRYPRPLLLEESFPARLAVGTCSTRSIPRRENVRGYFVPDSGLSVNVGW